MTVTCCGMRDSGTCTAHAAGRVGLANTAVRGRARAPAAVALTPLTATATAVPIAAARPALIPTGRR